MSASAPEEVIAAVPTGLLIDGEWRASSTGAVLDVEDPARGRSLVQIADASAQDAMRALDSACAHQDEWARFAPRRRGEILRRAFELMTERSEQLATLITLEMGKPLAEARAEVAYAAEFFRWFSEESVRIDGRWSRDPGGHGRMLTMKGPVGPCLLVTPWNFPLAMGARKIGPAIAAGCTIVIKPAQLTPLSTNALAVILEEAGLPAGVLNIVTSSSASRVVSSLMADSRLRKISFTGSTPVGRELFAEASQNLLRMSMELGGNAPFIVCEDADLDLAVEQAVIAKMRNMGQSCVAANRFYVHESLKDDFTQMLGARLAQMSVGPGTEGGVEVGPLIDGRQRSKVAELVEEAVGRGASVVTGGAAPADSDGYFWQPTVLSDVPTSAEMHAEEIFGPVAAVYSFGDDETALRLANGTPYGLVGYVFSRDLERGLRYVEGLETGMVGLNKGLVSNPAAPFGGVKWSGLGREGGPEGVEEYLSLKYVGIHLPVATSK
jgi:succinate-semialdehyde dehydrogenase/glutarate-semialdehyde dehydrogenase